MAVLTFDQALAIAFEKYSAGAVAEAESICWQILEHEPGYHPALHLAGVLAFRKGRFEEAAGAVRKAITQEPGCAEYHNTLGLSLMNLKEFDAAIGAFDEALRLENQMVEAHYNRGLALHRSRRLSEAESSYRVALQYQPELAQIHNDLGIVLEEQSRSEEAIHAFQTALALQPNYAEAYNNLGNSFRNSERFAEAITAYHAAIQYQPEQAETYTNLGVVLQRVDQLDAAEAAHRTALRLKPNLPDALCNLGNVLNDQGEIEQAIDCYQKATDADPNKSIAHANLLCMTLLPGATAEAIYQKHLEWSARQASRFYPDKVEFANDPNPNRRLKIGYVSPDFRHHVVGRNVLPLLRKHDHTGFEIFCYSTARRADDATSAFQACADHWREAARLNDDELETLIRRDGIDILVDLSVHTENNRLFLFARKPAPVQVTFAGYPGTTGLPTMDYRLTDPYLDPEGLFDAFYTERSYRLPNSFWCFDPNGEKPAVNRLPALDGRNLRFGCLNNFCKVNKAVLTLWAEVLGAIPDSTLLLLSNEGAHRERTRQFLGKLGLDPKRVEFAARRSRTHYLELYQTIDIALDTFPYNGHSTGLDGLWMGVPAITLVGETVVGRAGLSQLSNLGLTEWIAHSETEYARLARRFADDLQGLASLRATLRDRMQSSPLMNTDAFARAIETAFRAMWMEWAA